MWSTWFVLVKPAVQPHENHLQPNLCSGGLCQNLYYLQYLLKLYGTYCFIGNPPASTNHMSIDFCR